MCWLGSIGKENVRTASEEKWSLKIEDYFRLISNLPKSVKEIEIIGGGEPLLYPKIKLIFREIKRKKLIGSLVTNGSLLTTKMAKMLGEIGWNKVRISFNSATKIIYRKVNGADDFNKVIGNINDVINYRQSGQPEMILHFVIQKYNYREIYDFGLMSKKMGVNEVNFDYLLPHNKVSEKLLLSDKEWLLAIGQLKQVKGLNGLKNNVDDVLERRENHPKWNKNVKRKFYFENNQCYTINHFLYIFGDGRVLPCCVASNIRERYNIKDFTVAEIWQKYANFRKNVNSGKYYDFCVKECNMG
jgi:MoaA/NifB/PqqE/SkfB family radical SAM enzyme